MILDSSAILAVVLKEPGFEKLVDKVASASHLFVGAPTLAEAGIVLESRVGKSAAGIIIQLLHEWRVSIIPFGEDHWLEAIRAYSRYGKGRHKASLNFGDCLTLAAARLGGEPLLCTGVDFAKTDIELA
jgi:ribonuclease VapC